MKIVNIVPGFGGTFYCGNCLRDSGFIRALKNSGHDAHTLPIYLPLFTDDMEKEDDTPVFYGAVNIYLKQKFPIFRHMPGWMHDLLDSESILRFAAKKAGSTRAHGLEEMTISMLKGHEGYQKEELDALVHHLKFTEKPDVVHLSNALLLGLAYKIKSELNVPVVCSLQDEDVWIDAMEPSFQPVLWKLLSEKARDVSAFVAVSNYFAGLMKEKMSIPEEKLYALHIGVDPEDYNFNMPSVKPPVIGFLSRLNEENGLGILMDAFIELKKEEQYKEVKLRLSGGKTSDDDPYIRVLMEKLKEYGFDQSVEFIDDFKSNVSDDFFKGMSLLSVPVMKGEAFGLYQLEALASGIPIVQPALGGFTEIVEKSGGGKNYTPNNAAALFTALKETLSDFEEMKQLSLAGRKSVEEYFNIHIFTEKMLEIYKGVVINNL